MKKSYIAAYTGIVIVYLFAAYALFETVTTIMDYLN